MDEFKSLIRHVPDFPKKNILFYDITTLLKQKGALQEVTERLVDPYRDQAIDLVVGIESRGFIFAPTVACLLGAGFVPVRKPGKLPAEAIAETYDLEYGQDKLEVHRDAICQGQRVLLVDDLLATGGTAAATSDLVHKLKGDVVGFAFLIELTFLKGRDRLGEHDIFSLIKY